MAGSADESTMENKISGDDENHNQTPSANIGGMVIVDESKIEIIISRDGQSEWETIPIACPIDRLNSVYNRFLMAPERFVKGLGDEGIRLYLYALFDDWSKAQSIVENNRNLLQIKLSERGNTALHVAASAGSYNFVEELVKLMRPEDVLRPNSEDMLPVHLAALSGHRRTVQRLCSESLLRIMDFKDVEKLFFFTIRNNMFDVAMNLFKNNRVELLAARDEQKLTALHVLAAKSSEVLGRKLEDGTGSTVMGIDLLKGIWTEVKKLKMDKILALITQPSVVLFDAIKSQSDDVIHVFLENNDTIITTLKDPAAGQNLLHFLFLYRRLDIFEELKSNFMIKYLLQTVDNEGNNVLHVAAQLPLLSEQLPHSNAIIQMRSEIAWFKKAEKSVSRELRSMRNKKGETPIQVFYDKHKKLSDEIKESAKGIAESGMLVATLVATVAFAAALTMPGDKNNDWYIVFIVTNAVALFTSSASILSLLSNFTSSRFANTEFVMSLHPSLTFGIALLITSVAAMVVAFTAASFLIFHCKTKWASYLVASMGVFPLLLFLLFQFNFFDDIIWSRYYRLKLK